MRRLALSSYSLGPIRFGLLILEAIARLGCVLRVTDSFLLEVAESILVGILPGTIDREESDVVVIVEQYPLAGVLALTDVEVKLTANVPGVNGVYTPVLEIGNAVFLRRDGCTTGSQQCQHQRERPDFSHHASTIRSG